MSSHRRPIAIIGALLLAAPFAVAAPAAQAATTSDPAKVGMYGAPDRPFLEFDAVFVHSLAMLGLVASGGTPAPEAVAWLTAQQCPDGGFTAFRAPVGAPCPATDLGAFTGEDSNSTAVAAMALRAVGRIAEAQQAEGWLLGLRDGANGWPYLLGSGGDPNSTGLVLMALATAGTAPAPSLDVYADGVRVGCAGPVGDQGGITSPFSGGAPDLLATVQAVPGFSGAALPLGPSGTWADDAPALVCPEGSAPDATQVARHAAAWLEAQQAAGALDGANAGWAILGLRSVSAGRPEADALYAALKPAALGSANPGLVGLGALAAHALGETGDASSYRAAIAALLTTAVPTPLPDPTPAAPAVTPAPTAAAALPATLPDSGPPPAVLDMALVALGLLALGGGLLALGRRRGHADIEPTAALDPGLDAVEPDPR
jgi:hypothetical protein